ncbi:PrgI family protein [Patescibacteria group bacterium]|nr:PrgI family protein [Patescibacteria group bacterium]
MQDRFIVPQFIDAEDKIWGPITVRQFIIILAGALLEFIAYKLADFSLFLFFTVVNVILVILFAFYKVNGAPFHIFALNVVSTMKKPAVRIWRKEYIKRQEFKSKEEIKEQKKAKNNQIVTKSLVPNRKLSELSLIIDTGGVYKGERQSNDENNVTYR